jgi:hypothetical protein
MEVLCSSKSERYGSINLPLHIDGLSVNLSDLICFAHEMFWRITLDLFLDLINIFAACSVEQVFLKEYLIGNGQFKYSAGKGSANFNVDIPKIDRKIKGTGDLQVSGSQHVATVDIYYNADKNQDQKIHFHTDSDLKKDAINSK